MSAFARTAANLGHETRTAARRGLIAGFNRKH